MRITYEVNEALAAMPARAFLQKKAGISLNLWRKIKRSQSFLLNGQAVNPAQTIVQTGDIISYELREESSILPVHMMLDIRYEDDWLLIVNKPADLLMHPTTQERSHTLANAILSYYKETNQTLSFHPVHRLDRQTSGLVLIAKLPQIQHLLSTAAGKLFQRSYLALIPGQLTPLNGMIDLPIARRPGSIIERMVSPGGARPSRITGHCSNAGTAACLNCAWKPGARIRFVCTLPTSAIRCSAMTSMAEIMISCRGRPCMPAA